MSQQNTDISAMKRFTVAAGEAISMLARKAGMKLFAAKGKVEIQAQDDSLEAVAKKDISVTSVEGRVEIAAAKEIVVNCGGAYIRLKDGNIEFGCPGNILLKAANVQKLGPANYRVPPLEMPKGFEEHFTIRDEKTGKLVPYARYRITTEKGDVFEGRADAEGKTASIFTATPESLKIELL
jgi:type VI secretion system secreted protein VgrG